MTPKLVSDFLALTLPKTSFTHEAHLTVGLWHALHYTPEESLEHLRTAIKTFNVSVGGQNTDSAGYHETITRFYVLVIHHFLKGVDSSKPFEELVAELIAEYGVRDLPLRYWPKEVLMTPLARKQWVEPSENLPFHCF